MLFTLTLYLFISLLKGNISLLKGNISLLKGNKEHYPAVSPPDEPLVGHLVRAFLAEPERRVDVLEELHGLGVVDGAPGGFAGLVIVQHLTKL